MKKRLGLKEIRIDLGMFKYTIICVVGPYDRLPKYLAWKNDISAGEATRSLNPEGYKGLTFCYDKRAVPIVWIPKAPSEPGDVATLAHEMIHAMFFFFRWVEMPVGDDSEEVLAHGVAHCVTTVLTELAKK